jgi:hypothetical protein
VHERVCARAKALEREGERESIIQLTRSHVIQGEWYDAEGRRRGHGAETRRNRDEEEQRRGGIRDKGRTGEEGRRNWRGGEETIEEERREEERRGRKEEGGRGEARGGEK